jgi:hypothetical protein
MWKVWEKEKEKEMVVRVGVEILGLLVVRKLEVGVLCDEGHEEEEKEGES